MCRQACPQAISTAFHSYQADNLMTMQFYLQWNPIYGKKNVLAELFWKKFNMAGSPILKYICTFIITVYSVIIRPCLEFSKSIHNTV